MAELINLRQVRKRKARAEKDAAAEANRRKHGRSGAEIRATGAERERETARLDGHLLDGHRLDGPAKDPAEDEPES
jgi:hypothetical protein